LKLLALGYDFNFIVLRATSVDGFMCFYHTPSGRHFADVPLLAECLPDRELHAIEMAVFGILYGSWCGVYKQVIF
jgi:hypothetical protein